MAWSATRYDIERLENMLAYLKLKDELERRHHKKWVAIAGGRLVATAKTGIKCVKDANKAAPRATHRFVFRVGPRPRVDIRDATEAECTGKECRTNLINKLALGKRLKAAGGTMEEDYDKDRTCITLKDKTVCWKWQGKGPMKGMEENGVYSFSECIEITLDNTQTKAKKTICALLDSGKSGPFMFIDPGLFLDLASGAEDPDDGEQAETAGGKINVRLGFTSFEIPKVGFSMDMVYVGTNKDLLKAEVERRKKEEEKKKEKDDKKDK